MISLRAIREMDTNSVALNSGYTRKELGFRTAVLYSGSLVSGAFGGLVTAGITGNMGKFV